MLELVIITQLLPNRYVTQSKDADLDLACMQKANELVHGNNAGPMIEPCTVFQTRHAQEQR